MKTLHCTAGPRSNPAHATVQLHGYDASDPLTPRMASEAARVAYGHASGVTVVESATDPANGETWPVRGYRLSGGRARRIATQDLLA